MLEIYKTKDNVLEELQDFEEGAWINVVEPTQEEIFLLSNKLNIEEDFIKAALDEYHAYVADLSEEYPRLAGQY